MKAVIKFKMTKYGETKYRQRTIDVEKTHPEDIFNEFKSIVRRYHHDCSIYVTTIKCGRYLYEYNTGFLVY